MARQNVAHPEGEVLGGATETPVRAASKPLFLGAPEGAGPLSVPSAAMVRSLLCGLLCCISLHPLRIEAARGFRAPAGGGRAEPKGVQPAALAQAGSSRRRGRTPAMVGGIGAASGKASVSGRATHSVTLGGADFGLGVGGRQVCPAEERSPLLS